MRARIGAARQGATYIALAVLLLWAGSCRDSWAGIDATAAAACETMSHASSFREDSPNHDPDFAAAIKEKNWGIVRAFLIAGYPLPEGLTGQQKSRLARERISVALIPAAAGGNRATVSRLLRRGADPNARVDADDYAFPLAWAAKCDHVEIVEMLLAHGARVDARFSYPEASGIVGNSTALMWAAESGAREPVATLLAHHADPGVHSTWHFPPDAAGVRNSAALDLAGDREIRKMLRKALKDRASKAKKGP